MTLEEALIEIKKYTRGQGEVMRNGKMRGHEIDWRHYTTDRRSGIPAGYFDQGVPALDWFHILLGILIGFGLVTLLFFAASMK